MRTRIGGIPPLEYQSRFAHAMGKFKQGYFRARKTSTNKPSDNIFHGLY
jgi:hypothetical protein